MIMNTIFENQTYDQERALYVITDAEVKNCGAAFLVQKALKYTSFL